MSEIHPTYFDRLARKQGWEKVDIDFNGQGDVEWSCPRTAARMVARFEGEAAVQQVEIYSADNAGSVIARGTLMAAVLDTGT